MPDRVDAAVAAAAAALAAGKLVVIPTDTVYGLACTADREEAAADLYRLKGRASTQPASLLASGVELLLERLPELADPFPAIVRAVLPGAYTLVLPNPAHRFAWASGSASGTIGVRVPPLQGAAQCVVAAAGLIVATSANLPGGPDPRRVQDVPREILEGVAAVVDAGDLPGIPSTVIDLSGGGARVLRAGGGDVEAALACIAALR